MARRGNPAFHKGHKLAKGGARPGAGRPPNWYKKRCDDLLYQGALFNLLARIASGKETRKARIDGKVAELGPSFGEQVRAITELRDTAHGRPSQHVDVTNDQALMELLSTISLLIRQKVPAVCGHCKKDLGIREALAREFQEIGARFASKTESPPLATEDPS